MGLGPRIDIRQSQSLVLTPQLAQAIKLLQLSNLELEAAIAEELAKNPLLEATGGEGGGESVIIGIDRETGDEAAEAPAADQLVASGEEALDMDWDSEALQTDSFSDLGSGGSGGDEAFDF